MSGCYSEHCDVWLTVSIVSQVVTVGIVMSGCFSEHCDVWLKVGLVMSGCYSWYCDVWLLQ